MEKVSSGIGKIITVTYSTKLRLEGTEVITVYISDIKATFTTITKFSIVINDTRCIKLILIHYYKTTIPSLHTKTCSNFKGKKSQHSGFFPIPFTTGCQKSTE